jgi:hypothetical protein
MNSLFICRVMVALRNLRKRAMRELTQNELEVVGGGSVGGAAGACAAGIGAVGTMAWIAGAPTGGVGAAGLVIGGCLTGVALYYMTK